MIDEKINSTANNIQIDIDNLSYVNYLWTQRISETSIQGIRLDKRNLPTDTVYSSSLNSKVNKSGDTMSGNLNPSTNKGASLGTSSLYWNNIYGTTIYENGTSLANKYLGKTAKAADADKLDGKDSTYYLNYNNLANKPTIPTAGTNASAVSTTASGGSATTWSKSDHVHSISLATGDSNGQVKIAGTNVSVKGLGSAAYTASTAYATSGHTHGFDTITNRGEAFLSWGGKNFSGSYGPIDAAMVPELGANRLAFMPANAVTIEYSRDGGSTWTDYGPTDSQKINLFNGLGSSFTIGKATSGAGNIATNKYQLRVNIYTSAGHVYTALNKFVIYLSTSGTHNNWCTIRARKQSDYTAGNDKWTTFADKISVSGWSGYNVINTSGITTYGNTASTQYGHIQFIFGCDTGSTNNSYAGLNISKIFGFGGVGWTTPSTMAKTGHMYTYDSSQNVIFPEGVFAKSFTENGTSLANKYAAKSHTHNYAASDSAGGPANKVKKALTFGKKTYDGSSAQTITASDLGALTSHQSLADYVKKSDLASVAQTVSSNTSKITTLQGYFNADGHALLAVSAANDADGNEITTTYANQVDLDNTNAALGNKQDKLVSGTNLKTINGNSLLGSGNITISTSGTVDSALSNTSTNPVQNKVINSALSNKQDKLVSGTNIKTINGISLLGSGSVVFKQINGHSVVGSGDIKALTPITDGCNTIFSTDMYNASYGFEVPDDNISVYIRQGTITVSGTSFNASNTKQKITFSKKMPSNQYSLILTAKINNSTSREVFTTIYAKTTTDFTFNAHIGNTKYKITEIDYIAILID